MPERSELAQLVNAGLSDQEIADKLNVSSRTILRWRKRYNLPSKWTPPVPEHGTPGRYDRGCDCDVCRAGHASRHAAYMKRRNEPTARRATRAWEPWTPAEDAVVLAHTPAEAVPLLGRSWHACRVRRAILRQALEVATA